ncbi:MAG: DUF1580 domain-containing protein [Planctomycetota bacterium]|nr:DUF1580 domain-containing protein [Planctomycetota bacterium]
MQPNTLDRKAIPYTPAGFRSLAIVPPPSAATLHRWRLKGRFGICLNTFLRGGRRFTTEDAVEAWFEQITAASDGKTPQQRTIRQADDATAAAMRRLESEGL